MITTTDIIEQERRVLNRCSALFDLALGAHGSAHEIATLSREIIALGDADEMLHFLAYITGADAHLDLFQSAIIASGDAEAMVYLARSRTDVDFAALASGVIATGDTLAMVDFARQVPGVEVFSLQEAVIASGDVHAMCAFAASVDGADTNAALQAVVDSGDVHAMIEYARRTRSWEDVEMLQEFVIDTGDIEAMITFAREVSGADIERLCEVTGEPPYVLGASAQECGDDYLWIAR